MQIFNHQGYLNTGPISTGALTFSGKVSRATNPYGTPVSTEVTTQNEKLVFEVVAPQPEVVRFPTCDEINAFIDRERKYSMLSVGLCYYTCLFIQKGEHMVTIVYRLCTTLFPFLSEGVTTFTMFKSFGLILRKYNGTEGIALT